MERHPSSDSNLRSARFSLNLWLALAQETETTPGILFLAFAALTSLSQLFIAAFQADNPVIANGFKQNQLFAWIVLALCFLLMELRIRQSK